MKISGECEGCLSYRKNCEIRRLEHLYGMYDIKKCPCSICLLKVICQDACEEYNAYYNKVRVDRRYVKYE